MAKKKVNRKFNPPSKQANASHENVKRLAEIDDHCPVWQLKILDMEHPAWGWKNLSSADLHDVLSKLKNYETMKWKEIRANLQYNHYIPTANVHSDAQKRLRELQLDDFEELFRLRLGGKQRVWGILERYIFKILWWDPDHTVCSSEKKHT